MKLLSYKVLLIGIFLFVKVFSASSQSLMSLMCSQKGAIEVKRETNPGSKAQELVFYNNDCCDYYLVRANGKSYHLHSGRNMVIMKMGRAKSKGPSAMLAQRATPETSSYIVKPKPKSRLKVGSYQCYPGKFPKKLDKSFPYALPVKHGKETAWRTDTLENQLTLNFFVPERDTVYATRGGVVCKAGDGRQVLVYHADCTFAAYLMLESKFVSPGSEIHAGEPIGVASSEGVSISFYYLDKTQFRHVEKVADYPYAHFVPIFRTDEGDVRPEEGETYCAVTDDELITQEMSRREKRQYLKE